MLINTKKLWDDEENLAYVTSYILDGSHRIKFKRRPTVVICPGGGYLRTADREAEPVAMKFASLGYNAIILRYNTHVINSSESILLLNNEDGSRVKYNNNSIYPQPLFDLAKTMLLIHENSHKWNVDINNIIVCGFSAGAHLTAMLGTNWHHESLKEKFNMNNNELFKPKAIILGYPVINYMLMKENSESIRASEVNDFWKISRKALVGVENPSDEVLRSVNPANYVSTNTPPAFIWHTANDELVSVRNSLEFTMALINSNIKYELHIFEDGVHGLSLCNETTAGEGKHINPHCAHWFDMAARWLEKHR